MSSSPDPYPEPPCPFCLIAAAHKPYSPLRPPPSLPSDLTSTVSFPVLSTPSALAFLDIMPLSQGHILVTPRRHSSILTGLTLTEAQALGFWLKILSAAVVKATGVGDWNVVQNNGRAAAQVVGHVHFHIVPRPGLGHSAGGFAGESVKKGVKGAVGQGRTWTMFGRGRREELDEEEAAVLAQRIRDCLREELEKEGVDDNKLLALGDKAQAKDQTKL